MDDPDPAPARPARSSLSARREAESISAVHDPVGRAAMRAAFHVRRYSVVYVLGVLAVAALLLMPTVAPSGSSDLASAGGASNGGAYAGQQSGAGPSGAPAPSGGPAAGPSGGSAVPGGGSAGLPAGGGVAAGGTGT